MKGFTNETKGEKEMKKTIYTGITFMVAATVFITSSIALAGENTELLSLCNQNKFACEPKTQSENVLHTQNVFVRCIENFLQVSEIKVFVKNSQKVAGLTELQRLEFQKIHSKKLFFQ